MVKLLALFLAFVAVVCAGETPEQSKPAWEGKFRLQVTDEPANLRFSLVLVSEDRRDLCLEHGAWPDRDGKIETGGDGLFSVLTERETLKLHAPRLYADCWDSPECFIHIKPGESLKAFILYSEFGDPDMIRSRGKRVLKSEVVPSICDWKPDEKRR